MVKRLISSFGVWFIYGPYLVLLRILGPRGSIVLARLVALVHWLLVLAGAQGRARRAIARVVTHLQVNMSFAAILRRYVLLKHQRFVEWYVYPTSRGREFVQQAYTGIEGREHLDAALSAGKGAIVLMFHYGMGKMIFAALKELGYENYHHVFRGMTYAEETFCSVAESALKKFVRSEEESGLKIIYHVPFVAFAAMARHLRRNQIVGMNGDGMMGTDFVEAPFLGGTMPFPTGPARLAAQTQAPILSVYALPRGLFGHSLVVHPPIYCAADSPEAVGAAVKTYVGLLEQYVRRYPWAWWTWRRLNVEEAADGRVRYVARALSTRTGKYHAPSAAAALSPPDEAKLSQAG